MITCHSSLGILRTWQTTWLYLSLWLSPFLQQISFMKPFGYTNWWILGWINLYKWNPSFVSSFWACSKKSSGLVFYFASRALELWLTLLSSVTVQNLAEKFPNLEPAGVDLLSVSINKNAFIDHTVRVVTKFSLFIYETVFNLIIIKYSLISFLRGKIKLIF